MNNILTVAVVACFVANTLAQEVHVGRCPKVTTVQNFNVSRVRYKYFYYHICNFYDAL